MAGINLHAQRAFNIFIGTTQYVKECTYCYERFHNFREFHHHYLIQHSTEHYFRIPCGVHGSNKLFKKFASLRSHLSRDHRNVINCKESVSGDTAARPTRDNSTDDDSSAEDTGDEDDSDDGGDEDDSENGDDEGDVDEDIQGDDNQEENNDRGSPVDADDNLQTEAEKMAIAHFLLQIRATTNASNDLVTAFLKTMQEVVTLNVEKSLQHATQVLRDSADVNLRDYFDIEEELRSIDCSFDLDTIFKQNAYFTSNFGLIQPRRERLGGEFDADEGGVANANQRIRDSRDEMIVIPILEVCTELFANKEFAEIFRKSMGEEISKPDTFCFSKDGTSYFNHEFFKAHPNALRVKLYFDEVEVCDATGSKAGKQKLGMFYFQLENVSPQYNSKLNFINLIAIVKNSNIKKYGMNRILQPIVEELKKLQMGFDTPLGRIYGALNSVTGDNLGAHMVCGFKEDFLAHRPCRQCNANLNEVRTMTEENIEILRTPEEYDIQVHRLEAAEGREREELSTEFGINRNSLLNELEGFHVTTGAPPDIVHDSLEGFVKDTTKLMLSKYISENTISLDDLNQRINGFDYGYSEKVSKPSPIKSSHLQKDGKLHQSASQMWLLAVILPLILCNFVPEDCSYMANYIKMLEIMSICSAQEIRIGMVDYLTDIIDEYLEDFANLYKDDNQNDNLKNLTPKQHFLVHYPRLLTVFGPLVHYWTMRLEAKHQFFKRIVQAMRNYKNLPLTLARKHQLFQAFILYGSLKNETVFGPVKIISSQDIEFAHLFPQLSMLKTFNWIKLFNTKYVPKRCYLPIDFDEEECFPLFGELHAIVMVDRVPLLVCRSVKTIDHNMKLLAYEIEVNDNFVIYEVKNLILHQVFHCHKLRGQNFLIVKQMLGGTLH